MNVNFEKPIYQSVYELETENELPLTSKSRVSNDSSKSRIIFALQDRCKKL